MSTAHGAMFTTDRSGRWIQVMNPFRPQPGDAVLARLAARHDTIDARSAGIGFAVAAAVGGLLLLVTPIAPALMVAVAAGVSAAFGYRARYRFEVNAARAKVDALNRTLGPTAVSRSRLIGKQPIELADRAVESADRVLKSQAFAFGMLGDTDDVAQDVNLQLWEIIHLATVVDQHGADIQSAGTSLKALVPDDRPPADVVDAATDLHNTQLGQLRVQVVKFAAVADRCDQIDSRLRAPEVRERFEHAASVPVAVAAESAADSLIARVSAADDVLDAGGGHP